MRPVAAFVRAKLLVAALLIGSACASAQREARATQAGVPAPEGAAPDALEEWWVMNEDGCSLYVLERGEVAETPVVIVHGGFGAEHSYLTQAFDRLTATRHLVYYDQRGSLRSPYRVYERGGSLQCPDSLITFEKHVRDLERLRQELGVNRMTLIGHSMGAFLALSYAERFPARVAGLVLVSPGLPLTPVRDSALLAEQKAAANAMFTRPEIEVERKRAGVDGPLRSDKQRIAEWRIRYASANLYDVAKWRQLRGGMALYNPQAGRAAGRTMPTAYDLRPMVRARPCPTAIILGDHDISDMGARLIRQQTTGIAKVEVTVIPRSGHAVWIDQPTAFARAVDQALELCH